MYDYELWINGKIRRKTVSEFRPNVVTLAVEDILKLNAKQDSFTIHIKKLSNYNERGPEIVYMAEPGEE